MLNKIRHFLLRHELLIMILCLVAILRIPSLIEPYWYGDEAIYLTLGNGLRHGLTLYKDIHDNKPPGIYLIAAIAGSLFWFKFILLFWNLTTVGVFHWIATKILKPKTLKDFKVFGIGFPTPTVATVATLIFGLLPFFFEGNIANGEIFMILPTLIGFALLISMREQKKLKHKFIFSIFAGVFFSFGFLIKVPVVFDAIAAGIIFFLYPKFIKGIFSRAAWLFGLAFLTPILISVIYYTAMGAGKAYLGAALLQNVGYLSSWTTGTQQASLGATGLKGRAIGLLVITGIMLLGSAIVSEEIFLSVVWFGFALFGALLSERPYPHYLIQILAPLTLIFILLIRNLITRKILNISLLCIAFAALIWSMIAFKFWSYPILPYYQNYIRFSTHQISRDQYFSYFDASLPEQYKLASTIVTFTKPEDRIFVWGDLPNIYAMTKRLPPGRFTAAYHIFDFNGINETYAAMVQTNPKFILVDKRIQTFPHLNGILMDEYMQVYSSPNFGLYKRLLP